MPTKELFLLFLLEFDKNLKILFNAVVVFFFSSVADIEFVFRRSSELLCTYTTITSTSKMALKTASYKA